MTSSSNLTHWLTLYYAPGLSPHLLADLFETHGKAKTIIEYLIHSPNLQPKTRMALRHPPTTQIDQDLAWQNQTNQHIITLDDPYYPFLLKQIYSPPPVLYVHGQPKTLSSPQVAIVGSRKATPIGRQNAQEWSFLISQQGVNITSGLALGIDAAAHQGALDANNPTIAVLGSGLLYIYPKKHCYLADSIAEQGAVISEFRLKAPPQKHHFPQRNRIISGLSLATLVVEASLNSGSLITARYAIEQDREVFAMPGSIHNQNSTGTHYLIQNGAYLVIKYTDILEQLHFITSSPPTLNRENTPPDLDQAHHNLLECVDFAITSIEKVCYLTSLKRNEITRMLLNLELNGYIKKVTGGYIREKNEKC
jgi:DNA processing protein